METVVIPHIEDDFEKKMSRQKYHRVLKGKTIMTIEPKFILVMLLKLI